MRKITLAWVVLVAMPAAAYAQVPIPPLPAPASHSAPLMSSASSSPTLVTGASVTVAGVNAASGFFQITAGLPGCVYETIYIDTGTENGRAAYSTVLSARRSGVPMPWFTYSVRVDGICLLDAVAS